MKQSLPWNVTGIPAEARELARAAAAREGLSVGDWLTRRILAEQAARAAAAEPAPAPAPTPFRVERVGEARRERDEPGLRPVRSEPEGDATFRRSEDFAFRRIDETLRALARRIEAAERSQHDANRAMGAAAAEINSATREHTENFQQMNERIDTVERNSESSSLRDAVKALHQGLSRLAEQIAQTANESNSKISALSGTIQQTASEAGSKIASLTGTVEAMNGSVAKTREDAQRASRDVGEKVNALALRLKHSDDRMDAMESRVLATESRLENEDARIQEALGKHLSAIERNLDGIVARLEQSEKTRSDADNSVNEVLRGLNGKFETADKRTRDSMTELRTHLTELGRRLDGMETDSHGTPGLAAMPMSFSAPAPAMPMSSPMSAPLAVPMFDEPEEEEPVALPQPLPPLPSLGADFDLPPFPEAPPVAAGEFSAAAALDADSVPPPPAPFEEAFPEAGETRAAPQDYIAAARRAAKAAAEAEAQRKGRSTVLPPRAATPDTKAPSSKSNAKPFAKVPRLAAAAVLVVVVSALGFLITRAFSPFGDSGIEIETANLESPQATAQVQLPPVQGPQDAAPAEVTPELAPPAPAAAPVTAAAPQQPAAAPQQQAAARPAAPILARLTARANAGSADAALLLGLKYLDGDGVTPSDAEGVRWLTRAAGQGEALAQYRLGTLFERGRGVTQDPRQAFHWYEQSAKAGNRKAMHNLAVAFADGAGTEKNFTQAVTWFRSAADLGLVDSQFNLAVLYERGMGVPASLTEAYKWYVIAAGQGDAESKTRVEALQTQLQPPQRATAERAAAAFRAKAMDNEANEPPTLAQAAP